MLFEDGGSETTDSKILLNDMAMALASAGLAGRIRAESHDGTSISFIAEDLDIDSFKVRGSTGAGQLGFGTEQTANRATSGALTGLVSLNG